MKSSILAVTVLCIITLIAFVYETADAGDIHAKAGTTAFPFLKINIGARAVGMGGAFTGLADDESALYYNPAGIAAIHTKHWIGGYHNYVAGIQSGFIGITFPMGELNALAVHVNYLGYGEFIETDGLGQTLGTFGGSDICFAATFARQINRSIKIGLTAKYIYEKVQDYSATGVAFDLGVKYSGDRERFTTGLMLQNVGKQLSALGTEKYDLPLVVRGGIGYRPHSIPIKITSDLIVPSDNNMSFAVGGEYHEFKPLYLRLGWNSSGADNRTANSDDSWAGLSLGVGFDYNKFHIAYAFTPHAELGDSHRITMSGGF